MPVVDVPDVVSVVEPSEVSEDDPEVDSVELELVLDVLSVKVVIVVEGATGVVPPRVVVVNILKVVVVATESVDS